MDKETIGYLFTDLDDSQALNPRDEKKPQLTKAFSDLNRQGSVPNEQPQHRPFGPKNLKHPNKSTFLNPPLITPTPDLHKTAKTNRLRLKLPLHQSKTILHGHTLIHAPLNPKLYPLSKQTRL